MKTNRTQRCILFAVATFTCATHLQAAVITGESATATSEQGGIGFERTATKAINNSGISGPGISLATDGDFVHDNVAINMWQTDNGAGAGGALGEFITIDLQQPYILDGMRIWNFNEGSGGTDTAISVYNLETSPDNTNWTLRQSNQALAEAPGGGLNGYQGVYTPIDWNNVRYARITVVDTWRGSDDIAGLAEVMFSGVLLPNEPLITGTSAVASSQQNSPDRTAINTVNGSGITVNGTNLAADGDYEHNSVANGNMWQTVNPTSPGAAIGQTLTIDLNGGDSNLPLYNVSGMRIWNYNEASGGTDTAIAAYDLHTSPDGSTWTLQQLNQSLAQAPGGGLDGYDGVFSIVDWSNVRYVRFTVVDTYRDNDDIAGLSEVMFTGVPVPEPATATLFAIAGMLLIRGGRRFRK